THTNKIGILATQGTVLSDSYKIEINRFHPQIQVYQHAGPFWVPLVVNNEIHSAGPHYFVKNDVERFLAQSPDIDSIVLACTHYPLRLPIIEQYVPEGIRILAQGALVANSLTAYLQRHPEVESRCSKEGLIQFYTTDDPKDFEEKAEAFFGVKIEAMNIKV